MPQLDIFIFFHQFFTIILYFIVFYYFLLFFCINKMDFILQIRKRKIVDLFNLAAFYVLKFKLDFSKFNFLSFFSLESISFNNIFYLFDFLFFFRYIVFVGRNFSRKLKSYLIF